MNSKKMGDVYPKFTQNNGQHQTYLRKKHDGIWCLQLIKTSTEGTEQEALNYFLWQVYLAIMFSNRKDVITPDGRLAFDEDENQESEEQRLFTPYSINHEQS